jgi:hypothetical protein
LGPIVPLLLVALPGYYAATESDLYLNFPVMFNFIFGLIGTKVTNKLIVSYLNEHVVYVLVAFFVNFDA